MPLASDMIRDLFQILTQQRSLHYRIGFAGLALFWAAENFFIQSSGLSAVPTTLHPHFYQCVRFCIDLMGAAGVLLLFSRRLLMVLVVLNFFLAAIILAYTRYFHHPLSIFYAMGVLKEGWRVAPFALKTIPLALWGILFCALAAKVFWIFKITPQAISHRWQRALFCFFVAAFFIASLQFTAFRFSRFSSNGARAVYAYGYLNTWMAELCFSPDIRDVARELRQLQNLSPDRLSKTEPSWPIGNKIVVVQLESVDWNVLDFRIRGQEVMPYVSSLARTSRVFKIRVYHDLGSADMDYAVLSGGTPSKRMISYLVPDISYTNALPRFLQQHGFHTAAFHGNHGSFFNRRSNFEQMGFDDIWFKEDFKTGGLKQSYWGLRDAEVFRLSKEKMCGTSQPEFHFIITLDTHAPFDVIGDQEKEIFPHSQVWQENYFNSLRVLDRIIGDYVASLPAGTLVIFYGDHTAGVDYGDFHAAREGSAEYVPCIVHVCQPSAKPVVPNPPAPEELSILDVINHLRRQIARR